VNVCICVDIYMSVCKYACMCVCMYLCMCACMYNVMWLPAVKFDSCNNLLSSVHAMSVIHSASVLV